MKRIIVAAAAALGGVAALAGELADRIKECGCVVRKTDAWCGGERTVFEFEGREAWVVEPPADVRIAPGNPWTWTMQWKEAFPEGTGIPELLKRGFRHVALESFDLRMDESGLRLSARYQKFLVEKLGLAPKARLIGMSWGGFYSTRYAAAYPQQVERIYLDAPLLNFDGFAPDPAKTPTVDASKIGPWASYRPKDGWADDPEMPVNKTAAIAQAGIPILLLYGTEDVIVQPNRNGLLFAKRFQEAGGRIKVVARKQGHHPHGVPAGDSTVVDFLSAPAEVLPSPQHLAWADCEIGVLLTQDIQIYDESYNYRHGLGSKAVPNAAKFNPPDLDTDQWLKTAQAFGAKYAVLLAKPGSGFCYWPTKAHPYSVAASPWKNGKGDLVGDFVASCRKFGIRPGFYASMMSSYLDFEEHRPLDGKEETYQRFLSSMKTMLTELLTNYGEVFEVWFDGGTLPYDHGGKMVDELLVKHQPKAIVFQGNPDCCASVRWIGNEGAHAPETCWARTNSKTSSGGEKDLVDPIYAGDFDGKIWCPGEADTPNRDRMWSRATGWVWQKGQDDKVMPPEVLLSRYFTSVGRGCNLLLGMVVDDRGRVPEADVRQLTRFGEMVRELYSNRIGGTSGRGACFMVDVPKGAQPNLVSIQEDLRMGQNVHSFSISGSDDGENWHSVASGTSIGHRRLLKIHPSGFAKYRLDVWDCRPGTVPAIRDFSLYDSKVVKDYPAIPNNCY